MPELFTDVEVDKCFSIHAKAAVDSHHQMVPFFLRNEENLAR